jgi:hypothetical protein
VAIYYDPDHLNRQYSTELAPYLDKLL